MANGLPLEDVWGPEGTSTPRQGVASSAVRTSCGRRSASAAAVAPLVACLDDVSIGGSPAAGAPRFWSLLASETLRRGGHGGVAEEVADAF